MSRQIALPVSLPDGSRFASYREGENRRCVATLKRLAEGEHSPPCWLWGRSGVGKSHLLQAVARRAGECGARAVYLPLAALRTTAPEALPEQALEGLEAYDPVCLDDLDAAVGEPAWEEALFHLYNRLRDRDANLVIAARTPPAEAGVQLADLRSRLQQCVVERLIALDDAGKGEAIRLRARLRGMTLEQGVADYLMARHPRDPHALFAFLDRMDRRSLADQRRLTIPFVRELLAGGG